jgi:hypothetical protein
MKELSRQEWTEFRNSPLNEAYKLLVLQVYSGIKNSATFDGVSGSDIKLAKQIVSLLNSLGIYFRIIHKGGKLKIVFGARVPDVLLLYALQNKVFNENELNDEYGRILGYPVCCIKQFMSRKGARKSFIYTSTRFQKNPIEGRWVINYKLNILANIPLLFHMPCTSNCPESKILAEKVLKLYRAYDRVFIKSVVRFLRQPALVFNAENYVRFNGELAGNSICYSGIEHIHHPRLADGKASLENSKINRLVGVIRKADILLFNEKVFSIFKNKNLLKKVEYRNRPFQFYDFR